MTGSLRCALAASLILGACATRSAGSKTLSAAATIGLDEIEVDGATGAFAPDPSDPKLLELGRWYQVGAEKAFAYLDSSEGSSMAWRREDPTGPDFHVRRVTWAPADSQVLDDPTPPDWLVHYGPQPAPGTLHGTWRTQPAFAHRIHPDFPDDLRVIIGTVVEGQVRVFEIVWVRLLTCEGSRCTGALINQPSNVDLALGDPVEFDLDGVATGRLPAASSPGQPVPEALVTFAATSPRVAGQLQDIPAWSELGDVSREQRLPPVGRWVTVGDDIAFTVLGHRNIEALVIGHDKLDRQTLRWRPASMRDLPEEERIRLGLPEKLVVQGYPPQPPPGDWGAWRIDPDKAWVFSQPEAEPDRAQVAVGAVGSVDLEVTAIQIRGCDNAHCWGPLLEAAGGMEAGEFLRFAHLRMPEEMEIPVAWPFDEVGPAQ